MHRWHTRPLTRASPCVSALSHHRHAVSVLNPFKLIGSNISHLREKRQRRCRGTKGRNIHKVSTGLVLSAYSLPCEALPWIVSGGTQAKRFFQLWWVREACPAKRYENQRFGGSYEQPQVVH
jgi:hypothetical protein